MSKINATNYEDTATIPAGRKKSDHCVHAIVQSMVDADRAMRLIRRGIKAF